MSIKEENPSTYRPSSLVGHKVRELHTGREFVVNEIDPGEPALVGDGSGKFVDVRKVEVAEPGSVELSDGAREYIDEIENN